MRALASKFGAHLTFRYGESTGTIDLTQQDDTVLAPPAVTIAVDAVVNFNRAYWKMLMNMTRWGRAA